MTAAAWWMMALVCGFVWGGFGVLLVRALRLEGRKVRDGGAPAGPAGAAGPPGEGAVDPQGGARGQGGARDGGPP